MSKDLAKKAIEMLLNGATMVSEPCPYCRGVRIMKDGHAFCVSCGKEPKEDKKIEPDIQVTKNETSANPILVALENKLAKLSKELENESDHIKLQKILKTINSIIETMGKLKK